MMDTWDKSECAAKNQPAEVQLNRREFVTGAGALVAAMGLGTDTLSAEAPMLVTEEKAQTTQIPVSLAINGQRHRLAIDPRVTLLDVLREDLGLTGTKKGCDHGQCGACTVLVNGRRTLRICAWRLPRWKPKL